MGYKIPDAELVEVKVLDENGAQMLKFKYTYRNAKFYQKVYITNYHLRGKAEVKSKKVPITKKKVVERDYIKIAIQMLYHNMIKKVEEINK